MLGKLKQGTNNTISTATKSMTAKCVCFCRKLAKIARAASTTTEEIIRIKHDTPILPSHHYIYLKRTVFLKGH